jgi:hypothetical protein
MVDEGTGHFLMPILLVIFHSQYRNAISKSLGFELNLIYKRHQILQKLAIIKQFEKLIHGKNPKTDDLG